MNKTIAVMLVAAASVTACQVPSQTPPSTAAAHGDVNPAGTIKKSVGQTFTIPLKANQTTGYSWALDGKEDSTVVTKVKSEYVNDPHAAGEVGFGGTERWTFRAVKKGTTTLHFVLTRSWEKGSKPADEQTFKVQVE